MDEALGVFAPGVSSFAERYSRATQSSLLALTNRVIPLRHQYARQKRSDCGGRGDSCRAVVRFSPSVRKNGPELSARRDERFQYQQSATAASTASSAAATQAKAQGRRLLTEEHQERSDPRGCSQAEDCDAAGPADRGLGNAAHWNSSDPRRFGRTRPRNGCRRNRQRDRQWLGRKRPRRWRRRSCGTAASRHACT